MLRRIRGVIWRWRLRHNKDFMEGVERGRKDWREGKMLPLSEVMKELEARDAK